MDGSGARIIVQTELNHPSAIFFHAKTKRIFWSDTGRKRIESIAIDGTDRQIILADVEFPNAFTVWDTINDQSIMYYTDQVREQLIAFNLKVFNTFQ